MTPIRRLDHVAVAVRNTDAALLHFRDRLGLEVVHTEVNETAGARLTYLDAGNCWLQLVAPVRDDAPIAEYLAGHGEGIHHICWGVENVTAGARELGDGNEPAMGSGRDRPSAFVPGAAHHGTRMECTRFDYNADVASSRGWLPPPANTNVAD